MAQVLRGDTGETGVGSEPALLGPVLAQLLMSSVASGEFRDSCVGIIIGPLS